MLARPLFGPRRSILLGILVVVLYTLLVGAGASVVRAAIMSSLALIAARLGRRSWGLNTLAAATLVMTLQNPLVLWDLGFQLTAAATLGILLYTERLQAWVEAWAARRTTAKRARQVATVASDLFLFTFAAQLTTLSLLVYYFHQFSVVALLADKSSGAVSTAIRPRAGPRAPTGFGQTSRRKEQEEERLQQSAPREAHPG